MTRALAATLAVVSMLGARSRPADARSFAAAFDTPITRPIGDALARSIGRSLPVTAASPGVTFTFDPATGVFERETDLLGQLFLERPRPLGQGRWNVSVNYQWVRIDTVDGQDVDRLHDTRFAIVDPVNGRTFTVPHFGLRLETHQVTTSVTYGVTRDLDVNLTIPVVYGEFGLDAVARDQASGQLQPDHVRSSKLGIGDVFLRAKDRVVRGRWGEAAVGLVVRAPAGSEDDFQGTGAWELAPMLYGATPSVPVGALVSLQAYANAGVDLDAGDVDRSEGRFGAGLDCRFAERATIAVALLGREPFQGIAPPGFFDVTRVRGQTAFRSAIFGLQRDRASIYDVSIGGRVNLWHDTVFAFANAILPVTRGGFRSDVIPLAGVEAAF